MPIMSETEKNLLKKIAESNLITKYELKKYLESTGNVKDASSAIESITRRLMDQKLVSAISPVGSTCYIITQKGSQMIKEMEI